MPARATIGVTAEDGLLTISVSEPSSIDQVMQGIGKALGAKVEGGGCDKKVGPLNLSRITFKQALENVAAECSFIVERQGDTPKIRRILLIPAAAGQPPTPGRPLPGQAQQPAPAAEDDQADDTDQQQAAAAQQAAAMSPQDAERNDEAIALRDIAKLGGTNDTASRAELEKLAKSHPSVTVRIAALRTLAAFAAQGAGPFLESRLLSERDAQSRLAAAQALVQIDFELAKTAIAKAVAKERDAGVREQLKAMVGE